MLPLSFREFLKITGADPNQGLAEYMRDGGLPYIAVMNRTPEKVETYLGGIYNTVIVKDIEDRQASVAGNPVFIRSITDYLISNGRKVSPNTVSDYVEALTESFIFYPAERLDIVGIRIINQISKL